MAKWYGRSKLTAPIHHQKNKWMLEVMFTKISIDDDYINTVFNCFLERMNNDVLESFEGFLDSVTLVETNNKSSAAGVCNFFLQPTDYLPGKASIEVIRSYCISLSQKALIGVFAHEFGHLEDRLFNGECAELYNEDAELTANTIACYWGFKEEIMQMYKELSYLINQVPFDVSELDEELVTDYWETRHFQVNRLRL